MSKRIIINDQYYYHIYNRGVDKRKVFLDKWDYVRFLESMREFNRENTIGSLYHLKKHRLSAPSAPAGALGALRQPLIDILAYCLNPNHYHLLIRQADEDGISRFMQKLGAGYTCYFNEKYSRTGALFQGKYKFKPIASTIDLMKVSVYVNCNAEIHGIARAENWPWSSYLDYIGVRRGTLCGKEEVLSEFTNTESQYRLEKYKKYCREWIKDIRKIKYLQKFDIE